MPKYLFIFANIFFLILIYNSSAQDIVINEIMSSNTNIYSDEFGDSPDWIELYNASNQKIVLSSYYLSDDKNIPNKWAFPPVELNSDSIILINASGRDIKPNTASWETIIDAGDSWFYSFGSEPHPNWKNIGFIRNWLGSRF